MTNGSEPACQNSLLGKRSRKFTECEIKRKDGCEVREFAYIRVDNLNDKCNYEALSHEFFISKLKIFLCWSLYVTKFLMLPQGGTLRLQGGFGAFPGFFMFVRVDNAMTCNLKCCRGIQIEAEYKAIISTFFIKFFHILFELKLIERSHSNHFRFEENHHSARVGNEMLVQIYFFVEFFFDCIPHVSNRYYSPIWIGCS